MNGIPWLTVAGALPLLGAIVVALLDDKAAKVTAFLFSLVTLGWIIALATRFNTSGPTYQLTETRSWIPQFGVHYALGVDGIALVLIGMTAVLMPVVILASWHDVERAATRRSARTYFALMLLLETMMIGVFESTDVFLFYVFFEAMLIPMYFMIGSFGEGPRQYAAVKFLLYSLFGGLLMLVAVIALYVYSGHDASTRSFLFSHLIQVGQTLSPTVQKWLFLGFFIAFAIKAPLWPFHTWLPDAAASAQPGAAVLMLGVMDKVGTFGMIRYCLELFPGAASSWLKTVILTLAVISILYGAIVAIGQKSMKRLIGYTSISHFGFIVLGIFALTSQGQVGATLYMVNHGFATGALFILAGFLIARRGSDRIEDYGGVQKVTPVLAGLFFISGLAGLALPGLSTFVSEFLVLAGTFSRYKVAGSFAIGGIILAALYILWMVQRTMHGPVADSVASFKDLRARELWAVVPLIALIVAMGVYPKPVLDVINPAVKATMSQVRVTDPVPAHPAPASYLTTTSVKKGIQP
jgi:NADH-quinone oxidoreductase subunit M